MQKICLLALFALNALAPQVLAQDDDAELGMTPKTEPTERDESILEDEAPADPQPDLSLKAQVPPPEAAADTPPPPPPSAATTLQKAEAPPAPGFIESRRRPGVTYGLTVSRPQKIGKYNHYDYLYGNTNVSPGFYGGYYLGSYYADIGVVGRVSYYHDEGHPLSSRANLELPLKGNLTDQEKDPDQKLAITLIPTQLSVEGALAPFETRWLVLRAWVGWEMLYVSETVSPDLPDSTTTSDPGSTYTTSGWNRGLATGFMISFSLTGIDARSDKSLRSLGIDRYYLSLYAENVKTTADKFGNLDRKNYGIAFSFEGLR